MGIQCKDCIHYRSIPTSDRFFPFLDGCKLYTEYNKPFGDCPNKDTVRKPELKSAKTCLRCDHFDGDKWICSLYNYELKNPTETVCPNFK